MGRKRKDGAIEFEGGYWLTPNAKGVWHVEYTEAVPGGKPKSRSYSTGTTDKAAAETWLIEYRRGIKETSPGGARQHAGLSMKTVLEDYRKDCATRGKLKSQATPLDILERFFARYPAADVDTDLLEEYKQQRRAGRHTRRTNFKGVVKDVSLRREVAALIAAFNHSVELRKMSKRDVPYLAMPAAGGKRNIFLTVPEIEDMLARAMAEAPAEGAGRMPKITRFVWLALWTGSRAEALEQLTWDQVDFAGGVIRLHKSGAVETAKRRAPIPIAPRLRPVLERAWRERVDGFVCDAGECVCQWARFRDSTPYAARGLTRHDLRRSFIIKLVSEGKPLAKVAQAVGDTVEVITKHYLDFAPDFLDDLWTDNQKAA